LKTKFTTQTSLHFPSLPNNLVSGVIYGLWKRNDISFRKKLQINFIPMKKNLRKYFKLPVNKKSLCPNFQEAKTGK
jgi:hypothetical protein